MEKYLTKEVMRIFSLLCIVIAIFQTIIPTNISLFYINTIIGSFFSLYVYLYIIYNCKNRFDPYLILAFSIGFGYILSTLTYLLTNKISNLNNITNIKSVVVNPDSYGYALSLVLFIVSVLCITSTLTRSLFIPYLSFDTINKRLKFFLNISFFISISSFALGINGYRGAELSENGGLNPFAAFVLILLPIQSLFYLLLSIRYKFYLIFLIVSIILISLSGRRNVLYLFLIFPICMVMFGHLINISWFVKKIHYIFISALCFLGLSYFFIALRVALNKGEVFSSVELFSVGSYYILNNMDDIILYIQDTSSDRSFIISYLAILIDKYNFQKLPIYGLEFYYAVLNNFPSLFVDKDSIPSSMEDYTHPLYGIPAYDDANSVVVSGLNDFYIYGSILYPLIIGFISLIFLKVINNIKDDFIKTASLIFIIYNFIQIEISMTTLLGVYRSIFIFILFYFVFNIFYKIFSKSKP